MASQRKTRKTKKKLKKTMKRGGVPRSDIPSVKESKSSKITDVQSKLVSPTTSLPKGGQ